jgi:hypothetical protein
LEAADYAANLQQNPFWVEIDAEASPKGSLRHLPSARDFGAIFGAYSAIRMWQFSVTVFAATAAHPIGWKSRYGHCVGIDSYATLRRA